MAATWKDVVVIGGGPAGSVTARQLASRGCNVLLVDARQFPREKPCGGGIQHRCLRFLPEDFPSVAKAVCTSVRLTHGLRATTLRNADRPVVHCVNRAEFDHYLLGKPRPQWMDKGVSFLERGTRDVSGMFKRPTTPPPGGGRH